MKSKHSIKLPMIEYDVMKMSVSIYFKCSPPHTPYPAQSSHQASPSSRVIVSLETLISYPTLLNVFYSPMNLG